MWHLLMDIGAFMGGAISGIVLLCAVQMGKIADEDMKRRIKK